MARRRRSSRRNPYTLSTRQGDRQFYDVEEINEALLPLLPFVEKAQRRKSKSSPAASVSPDDPITYDQARTIGRNLGSMQEWCPAAYARLSRSKDKVTRYDVLKGMGVTAGVASQIMQKLYDIGFDDDTKEERKAIVRQMLADAGVTCELPGSTKKGKARRSTSQKSKKRRSGYYTGDLPF